MIFQKRFLLFTGFLYFIFNSNAQLNDVVITSDSVTKTIYSQEHLSLYDSVINYGKLFLKTPYRYGSPGASTFDCSGFTSYVYHNFGYNLERSSSDQAEQFPSVKRAELKPGDLVFFEGRRRNGHVGHVGIVVETNDSGHFDFIHAAVHSGVTISNSKEAYYLKRFVKAGRIIGSDTTGRIKGVIPKMKRDEYVSLEPANSVKITVPAKYHKVRKGENLSTIAEKYGLTLTALKQKNHLKKNNISINQRLKIKDAESYTKAETITAEKPESSQNKPDTAITNTESIVTISGNTLPTTTLHTVKKGETLNDIANHYNVSVSEIKNINNLKNSKISIGQELRLVKKVEQVLSENNNEVSQTVNPKSIKPVFYKVEPGENLFSIAQKYNVTVDDIINTNHLIDNKIVSGQMLEISCTNTSKMLESDITQSNIQSAKVLKNKEKVISYKVKKGESLYTIAKLHNISVEDLKQLNQLTDSKIQQGQVLIVSQTDSHLNEKEKPTTKIHKVRSGESFYSIAQKYGCTVNELKKLNGISQNRLDVGDKLKVFQKK